MNILNNGGSGKDKEAIHFPVAGKPAKKKKDDKTPAKMPKCFGKCQDDTDSAECRKCHHHKACKAKK